MEREKQAPSKTSRGNCTTGKGSRNIRGTEAKVWMRRVHMQYGRGRILNRKVHLSRKTDPGSNTVTQNVGAKTNLSVHESTYEGNSQVYSRLRGIFREKSCKTKSCTPKWKCGPFAVQGVQIKTDFGKGGIRQIDGSGQGERLTTAPVSFTFRMGGPERSGP